MSFISTASHEKVIQIFRSAIGDKEDGESSPTLTADTDAELLQADIDRLQRIMQEYKNTFSRLQDLTRQYKTVLQRTRVNMRKHQLKTVRGKK